MSKKGTSLRRSQEKSQRSKHLRVLASESSVYYSRILWDCQVFLRARINIEGPKLI